MTKRCNASIMNDVASPFWDENKFIVDFCDCYYVVHLYVIKQIWKKK